VLGTRPDGFHELDALTVSVSAPSDVVDVVSAGRGHSRSVVVTGATEFVPSDDSNLAARAARAAFDRVGTHLDVRIGIHKEIPSGGGLGGGSADAAATLVALRTLFDNLGDDDAPSLENRGPPRRRGPGWAPTCRSAWRAGPRGCAAGASSSYPSISAARSRS